MVHWWMRGPPRLGSERDGCPKRPSERLEAEKLEVDGVDGVDCDGRAVACGTWWSFAWFALCQWQALAAYGERESWTGVTALRM